ncbi:FAD-dependent monooxygenase fsr3 [Fusarium oxysporum f. sp. albedinis]|nr:FAD-dependent monooxygenase fsr3 [Fusarium oxysporum f. sp. albedinis]
MLFTGLRCARSGNATVDITGDVPEAKSGAKWSYNPEELPQGFESGYSHVFGREKTQYVFTCFPKYRVQYSDGELKTLLKHAEGLEHAVTSHQILDQSTSCPL